MSCPSYTKRITVQLTVLYQTFQTQYRTAVLSYNVLSCPISVLNAPLVLTAYNIKLSLTLRSAVVKSPTEGLPEEDRQSQVLASPILLEVPEKRHIEESFQLVNSFKKRV